MDDINAIYAVTGAPAYTIREQLAQREDSWLREIAMGREIGVNPELVREELIDGIADKLASKELLRQYLLNFSRQELEFFREASDEREIRRDDLFPSRYGISLVNGLLSLYYHDGGYLCVVPEEIRAAFHDLERTSFPADWERCDLLRTYGRAVTEFYGVIKIADVIDIFNAQNDEPTNEVEFSKAVSCGREELGELVVEEEYLFSDLVFEDADWEEIENLAHEAARKPRYIPSRDEVFEFPHF